VLGSINMIWGPKQRSRQLIANLSFFAALLTLIALYGAITAIFFFHVDIGSKLAL